MKSLPKTTKTLKLSRETVRTLTGDALEGVVGGVPPDLSVNCSNTCVSGDICAQVGTAKCTSVSR